MFKKYYFFTALAEKNRFLNFVTEAKNPIDAYDDFREFVKQQKLKDFNIKIFKRIK